MSKNKVPITPIPNDRPVVGADITELARLFGFTTLDSSHLLGLYPPQQGRMTSDTVSESDRKKGHTVPGRERPISDPTRALLLRFLSRHPEYCPIQPSPSPHEVYEAIQQTPGYEDYKLRWLGPLLGCELSSGYRWFSGSGVSPVIGRYLSMIMALLSDISADDRKAVLDELRDLAETEAATRGVDKERLWDKGTWRPAR